MPEQQEHHDTGGKDYSQPDSKTQFVELSVFLFLIFPSLVLFLFIRHQELAGLDIGVLATVFHDLALVSLIAFFLWRNGEPIARVGWSTGDFRKEVLIGVALFVVIFLAANLLDRMLAAAGLSAPHGSIPSFLSAKSPKQYVALSLMIVVVAFAEETIFRGYLILRLRNISHSNLAAVLISSVIFSLGHSYEGTAGMTTVFFIGSALAVIYLWRKNLVAPMVIHFLQDFVSIILLPLLK